MTILSEKQFEILPEAEAPSGFVFGIGAAVSINDGGFDPGESNWFTQDGENTRRGVVGFGRDVPGAKNWIWSSHVDQLDLDSAVAVLEEMESAWTPSLLVRNPGAVTALRYRLAGRDRRVFGRPRRFAAPPTNLIDGGYIDLTHEFQTVDAYTYDDLESSMEILYASSVEGGGFVLPTPMPITTQPSLGNGSSQISIGGTKPAYPIIRFNGPWINPVMHTDNWTLRWNGSIPAGGWVEIDARPWVLTVTNQDGASAVAGLDRRVWLEDLWFAPKSQPQISLEGVATSGGASATVRWRNTWTSI